MWPTLAALGPSLECANARGISPIAGKDVGVAYTEDDDESRRRSRHISCGDPYHYPSEVVEDPPRLANCQTEPQ